MSHSALIDKMTIELEGVKSVHGEAGMESRYAPISFQQIDCFLSAAKHENFTRAAEELNMTQATISRNIAALEEELGIILFIRHKRRVRLTNAGRYLEKELTKISNRVWPVFEKAYELQGNQFNTLVIGDYNSTPTDAYLFPVLERFEKKHPDVETQIFRNDPVEVIEGLSNGQYDLIFSSNSSQPVLEKMNMEFVKLFDLTPCLVISSRHSLFRKKTLTYKDLRDERVVTMQGERYSPYNTILADILEKYGFSKEKLVFVDNPHSMLMELQRKDSVALMDIMYTPMSREELRYLELPGCKPVFGFGLAYSSDNQNPNIQKFITSAKTHYKKS